MKGMKTQREVGDLQERVAGAIQYGCYIASGRADWADVAAGEVLKLLGLDDLDAAARRAAKALWDREQASEAAAQQAEYGNDAGITVKPEPFDADDPRCDWYWQESRRVLETALTATQEGENG